MIFNSVNQKAPDTGYIPDSDASGRIFGKLDLPVSGYPANLLSGTSLMIISRFSYIAFSFAKIEVLSSSAISCRNCV